MKLSPRSPSCIILCIIICLVLVSGCTVPPKTNNTPPALIPNVQAAISPSSSSAAPGGGCAEGQTTCSGACRNTLVDSSNCGRCGNVCSASQYCNYGVCSAGTLNVPVTGITTAAPAGGMTTTITVSGSLCPTGYTPCSGICRNLESDMSNCGRCGNVCGSGRTCSSGACSGGSITTAVTTLPAPLPDSAAAVTTTTVPELLCWSNNIPCAGTCIDPNTDNNNCRGCGNVCDGGRSCVSGMCRCPGSLTFCGGTCVDVNTDTRNCGSCGHGCMSGATCCSGVCTYIWSNDDSNCGACGNVCPTGHSCSAGTCVPPAPACPPSTILCGTTCVNTETDNYNCGGCGVTCYGDQTCVAGVCTAPIPAPCPKYQTACLFKGSVICVDLDTDNNNCGYCGHVCTTGSCSGGTCSFILK